MNRFPFILTLGILLVATPPVAAQERQCLVAVSNSPAQLLVAAVEPDGSLSELSDQALPGASARLTGMARCGRFVYATAGTSIAGFHIDDAGSVTPLPGAVGSQPYSALACDEGAGLLFAGTEDPFSNSAVLESFTVASDGGLLLADSLASVGSRVNGLDIHPTNGDVFYTARIRGNPTGTLGNDLEMGRVTADGAGAFGAVERVDVSRNSLPSLQLLRFTADGLQLALAGFTFVSSFPFGGDQCFFHYEGPFTTLAALGTRRSVCSGPLVGRSTPSGNPALDVSRPGRPARGRGPVLRPLRRTAPRGTLRSHGRDVVGRHRAAGRRWPVADGVRRRCAGVARRCRSGDVRHRSGPHDPHDQRSDPARGGAVGGR